MNAYPDDYAFHNLPLLLLSGLDDSNQSKPDPRSRTHTFLQDGGFMIRIDLPNVQGPLAEQLLQAFNSQDASNVAWHSRSVIARSGKIYKIANVGRVYTLPPRKAPPPPYSPRLSATVANGSAPPPLVLHSPLSPLTPSSPLYADGIFSPLWITKHQSRLPCAFLACFSLTSDPHTSSLQDNKLKSEVGNIRSVLSSTNYKTKLVVVLIGDGFIDPSELEDRFNTIRRSGGLDGKSIFFLPHNASPVEVTEFVNSVLSTLHSPCIEYYRDLSKHCRRKRNRNIMPQPTVQPGASQVLSLQGWNVRYEFKLGVFAEFRQEMDAACRNYETAYDGLFSPEIIETIAVWSLRFNEARSLADVVALRIVRCLLWVDQGTTAVRSWIAHRERVRDLIDRRGKGTENYGWEAWQSNWAAVMADLLSRSQYPLLNTKLQDVDLLPIFVAAEKTSPGADRSTPWELLHHEGYWLDIARKCTSSRRAWALKIPEEDRQSPGRSPASVVASKAHLYDTYLALEPYREVPVDGSHGYDYSMSIISRLEQAIKHFSERGQLRKVDILQIELALEHVRSQSWTAAVETLQILWHNQQWRRSGWWKLLQKLGWALLDCLSHAQNSELHMKLSWELSCGIFESKPGSGYDLHDGLRDVSAQGSSRSAAIDMDQALSPVFPSFAFSTHEVFVGEPLDCQLTLHSRAQETLAPIRISEVKVVFEGSLNPIYLVAEEAESTNTGSSSASFQDVVLQDSTLFKRRSSAGAIASLAGKADLVMPSNYSRIFRLRITPREAGDVAIASITLLVDGPNYSLAVTSSDFEHSVSQWWETKNGKPIPRLLGEESNAYNKITIQPKPPKLQIEVPGLRRAYYANETIKIGFDIQNDEEEAALVSVTVRMISPVEDSARIKWIDPEYQDWASSEAGLLTLSPRDLGTIAANESTTVSICLDETVIAVDHEVELLATYRLVSEPETILTKNLAIDVVVIRPFEANYDFVPRLDPDPWPSFFHGPPLERDSSTPLGLRHRYWVTANLYSFATEPLTIEAILLTATKVQGRATCSATTGVVRRPQVNTAEDKASISSVVLPDQTTIFDFELSLQKEILGDRHTVGVDLALEIGWRRQDSDQVNTTVLEVPKLVAAMAEPRVLLTASQATLSASVDSAYKLTFTLENPSMHFLTFNISLEASEDFAFSGPKACSLSLVPLSRQSLDYRILPNKKDQWVGVHLNVIDAYFGQTLRILPGGDGVKVDKKGKVFVKI
ncbi:uncharacterized protein PV06_10039 [Exophiala oligosperma]|uniref:Gryzun putative trafficking through Golgi domain-containing protein n=1 Tax=Exophiala oligosperma TaxID=215243 RepID=A0A0D2D6S0_9EURO|nr:uncharacterized protein PV06_10039 [Exophiala oligosperma]KIW38070.1 hypothetical protein PV06_10039 [Exophiala oligosperma]